MLKIPLLLYCRPSAAWCPFAIGCWDSSSKRIQTSCMMDAYYDGSGCLLGDVMVFKGFKDKTNCVRSSYAGELDLIQIIINLT
jgi:hypothetical protein